MPAGNSRGVGMRLPGALNEVIHAACYRGCELLDGCRPWEGRKGRLDRWEPEGSDSLARNGDPESPGMTGGLSPRLRRLLAGAALAILAIIAVEQLELTPSYPMTRTLMQTQDVPVLVPLCALLIALAAWPLPAAWNRWAKSLAAGRPPIWSC